MHALLTDLYGHQAWADARHWHSFCVTRPHGQTRRCAGGSCTSIPCSDSGSGWLGTGGSMFARPALPDGSDVEHLRPLVRACHEEMRRSVARLTDSQLAAPVQNAFAPPEAPVVTLGESLTQCALHSQYHRGQNATRLRELGAEPLATDLIAWYWSGRGKPRWE